MTDNSPAMPDPDRLLSPPWCYADWKDMIYVRDKLDWIIGLINASQPVTGDVHGNIIRDVLAVHERLTRKELNFIQQQARIKNNPWHKPAGSPGGTGGEFDHAPENGGAGHRGGNDSDAQGKPSDNRSDKEKSPLIRLNTAIAQLEASLQKRPTGWCAQYVREALNKAGIELRPPGKRPGKKYSEARDYGSSLKEAGFKRVNGDLQPSTYPPESYSPKKGDIAVIQSTSRNIAGHMALYNGKEWLSDYRQREFWPGQTYRIERPDFDIYRMTPQEE